MARQARATAEHMAERAAPTSETQAGALFGPGEATPGVRGLSGREGMPRQWA